MREGVELLVKATNLVHLCLLNLENENREKEEREFSASVKQIEKLNS